MSDIQVTVKVEGETTYTLARYELPQYGYDPGALADEVAAGEQAAFDDDPGLILDQVDIKVKVTATEA